MAICKPIGRIETPFESSEEAPRQGFRSEAIGEINLDRRFRDGLRGLDAGDMLDIIWFAHEANRSILCYPDREEGVFAMRTQDRPTPICITTCELLEIEDTWLRVQGVDMIDDTPVLDLKPALSLNEYHN